MSSAFRTFEEMSGACEAAWRHLDAGEADAAQTAFLAFWARNDIGVKALRGLARQATAAGDGVRAEALWRTLDALVPGDRWTRHSLGVALMQLRRFEDAAQLFSELVEADPHFVAALRGLAQTCGHTGDFGASLGWFEKAAESDPQNIANRRDCVTAAVKAREWARAEGHIDALRRLGDDEMAATLAGVLDQARRQTAPADLWARFRAAEQARGAEELAAARQHYDDILGADPGFVPALRSLAALERGQGDEAKARRILSEGLARRPDDPWLLLDQAQQCVRDKRFEEAQTLLTALIEGDGASAAAAALDLFYLQKMRGREGAAAEVLAAALQKAPDDRGLQLAQAGLWLAENHLDVAEAAYKKLADGAGDRYWPLVGLGNIFRARDDVAAAAMQYLSAIDVAPERPQAYSELAALSGAGEARAAARDALRAWAARRPDDPEPLRLLARLTVADRDFPGAAHFCAELLARWPGDVSANLELANLLLRQGDAARANQWFSRALALAPDHVAVLEARARRAELSDDLPQALALYEKVLEKDPARHWIALEKVKLQLALGAFEAALAELDAFRDARGETSDYFVARIDLFKTVGDLGAAAAAAEAGRKAFPRHARLRLKAALLDAELGRFHATDVSGPGMLFADGMSDLAQWRLDAASEKISAARAAAPDDGWILDRLIHTDLLRFDLEKAGDHLRELARLNRGINRIKGVSASPSQTHYGQLFDEFRLDRDACARTREALAIQGEERIDALRKVVGDFPDYTPGAIALLIALRQSGAFRRDPMNAGLACIPFALTQFWDSDELPADLETYVGSWRAKNPGLAHRRVNEGEARAFLRELGAAPLRAFDRAAEPAMKADIFRLGWLFEHGGIYADCDDRCQADLTPMLNDGAELVLYQEDIGSVGNNFIACAPKNLVVGAAFDEAVRAVNQGKTEILWLATGPGLMTRMLGQALAEEGGLEKLSRIRVLDRHEALAFAAMHCAASYKRTERHWSRTAFGASPRRAG